MDVETSTSEFHRFVIRSTEKQFHIGHAPPPDGIIAAPYRTGGYVHGILVREFAHPLVITHVIRQPFGGYPAESAIYHFTQVGMDAVHPVERGVIRGMVWFVDDAAECGHRARIRTVAIRVHNRSGMYAFRERSHDCIAVDGTATAHFVEDVVVVVDAGEDADQFVTDSTGVRYPAFVYFTGRILHLGESHPLETLSKINLVELSGYTGFEFERWQQCGNGLHHACTHEPGRFATDLAFLLYL